MIYSDHRTEDLVLVLLTPLTEDDNLCVGLYSLPLRKMLRLGDRTFDASEGYQNLLRKMAAVAYDEWAT